MEVEVVESLDMQHAPFEDCASQFYSLLGRFICFSSIFFYDSIPDFLEKKEIIYAQLDRPNFEKVYRQF